MIIVLIHWQIRSELEPDFLHFWSETATIVNRDGLIGEYLSKVVPPGAPGSPDWITWYLDPESLNSGAIHYVNVGMWESEERFYAEIADKFNDTLPLKEFELNRRRRMLLRPERHRVGPSALPTADAAGVK